MAAFAFDASNKCQVYNTDGAAFSVAVASCVASASALTLKMATNEAAPSFYV